VTSDGGVNMNQGFDKNRIAIIIGGLLVLLGVWQLAEHFFGEFFDGLWRLIGVIVGVLGSLVVIVIGVLLVIAARKDKLDRPLGKKFYRSTRNKKIAGICGGIAEYFNLEHATIRILTLILAVISWYVVVPLYIVLWIVVPPDTQSFNTWI
jgi:phage shock protein PspC (stress-responsive transcriptional regulator)